MDAVEVPRYWKLSPEGFRSSELWCHSFGRLAVIVLKDCGAFTFRSWSAQEEWPVQEKSWLLFQGHISSCRHFPHLSWLAHFTLWLSDTITPHIAILVIHWPFFWSVWLLEMALQSTCPTTKHCHFRWLWVSILQQTVIMSTVCTVVVHWMLISFRSDIL